MGSLSFGERILLKLSFFTVALIGGSLFCCTFPALAAEVNSGQLEVQDCTGVVRAVSKLELGLKSRVVVKFEAAPDSQITIQNNANNKQHQVSADGVVAAFDEIGAGSWKVCPVKAAQPIEWVSISQSSASSTLSTPVLVGGSVLGAGIAAMGLGSSSGSNSSDSSSILLSGSPKSEIQASNSTSAATQAEAANECINNRTPDPISAFF